MSIQIENYNEKLSYAWDSFVNKSNNGTIFHERKFLNYHPKDRFIDNSLVFKDGQKIVALFPAVKKLTEGMNGLISHRGASYGGFVYNDNLSIQLAFDLVESLLNYAKSMKFEYVDMTLPPIIYQARLNNYLEFALYKNGFTYRKREISSVIPLNFKKSDVLKQFKSEARTAYRHAKKLGLVVRESEDYEDFYKILKRNLKIRHGVSPTHTVKELKLLKSIYPKQIHLMGAYVNEEMAGGVVNFICNKRVVLAFYISHNDKFQKYRPVNALFYNIIKKSVEDNYKYLDYGIFTVNEEPNWNLGKFKESFGARGVFRDSFEKKLTSA